MDLGAVEKLALGCTKCRLAGSRTQVVWADGNLDSKLLFVGEAPGRNEDLQGKPFVGAAGQLLDRLLAEIGLDRSQAAIANVIKCRPPGNRDPLPDEIEACRPWLQAQLAYMQPDVIVTLGNFATKFILESPVGITRARGRVYQKNGSSIVPTFHPAAALRGGRFGGMDPVDAIRADLRVAAQELEAKRAARAQPAPEPEQEQREAASAGSQEQREAASAGSQQLGFF